MDNHLCQLPTMENNLHPRQLPTMDNLLCNAQASFLSILPTMLSDIDGNNSPTQATVPMNRKYHSACPQVQYNNKN